MELFIKKNVVLRQKIPIADSNSKLLNPNIFIQKNKTAKGSVDTPVVYIHVEISSFSWLMSFIIRKKHTKKDADGINENNNNLK